MSQPTTCFGLFYLGHLQVGYLSQRKIYNSAIQPLKSGGDEISSPPDFNGCIALLYIFL